MVVKVVCFGCQPRGCGRGVGEIVRVFLRDGVLFCRYLFMAVLPLGILRISVYVSRAVFQATLNGMERIGVSSSFGRILVSWAGVMPVWICWHRCLSVIRVVFHRFTW